MNLAQAAQQAEKRGAVTFEELHRKFVAPITESEKAGFILRKIK